MRPSNRGRILQATIAVAEQHGIQGVTIEAVAAQAGMTKGGVQYHFGSKELMLDAVAEHLCERFDAEALAALGTPFEESDLRQRLVAYARSAATSSLGAGEITLFLETSGDAATHAWQRFYTRWTTAPGEEISTQQRVAILAVDGLWMDDISPAPLTPDAERAAVVEHILALLMH